MNEKLKLIYLLIVLLTTFSFLLILNYKYQNLVKAVLKKIEAAIPEFISSDYKTRYMLLNYSSSEFKQIDKILAENQLENIVIVISAPSWLINAKRRKWVNYVILDPVDIGLGKHSKVNNMVFHPRMRSKKRKYLCIRNVLPYLQEQITHEKLFF